MAAACNRLSLLISASSSFQLLRFRDRHAAELGLPVVVRRIADALLTAQVGQLHSRFDLLQDADHLFISEPRFYAYASRAGSTLLPYHSWLACHQSLAPDPTHWLASPAMPADGPVYRRPN